MPPKKKTLEEVAELFFSRGYSLMSNVYLNSLTPVEVKCPKGHVSKMLTGNFRNGANCKFCAGCVKKDIDKLKEHFEKEGYILTSTIYKNNHTPLSFICPKGHKGNITWNNFKTGSRCNQCGYDSCRGENNYNYNPNLTNEDRERRDYIPANKKWSKDVLKSFNFTCYSCGDSKGGNLNAHHLWSYSDNPELRLDLDNGICLCNKCHTEFHNQYGYGENNPNQMEEYLGQF